MKVTSPKKIWIQQACEKVLNTISNKINVNLKHNITTYFNG